MILFSRALDLKRRYGIGEMFLQTYNWLTLNHPPHKMLWYWINRFTKPEFVMREIQGSKMILNLKDRGANADLFLDGIREDRCTRYFQCIMKPDWTVIEVGAHIGYYALQEAQRVKEVYAIEPDPKNVEMLTNNVLINKYQNVHIYNMAVGDYEGIMPFYQAEYSNLHRIATEQDKNTIEVPMMTIDKFVEDKKIGRVDFVRMDVEGYELYILRGMTKTIQNNKLGMFIEVHRDLLEAYGDSLDDLLIFLEQHDFVISKSLFTKEIKELDFAGEPLDFPKDVRISKILLTQKGSAFWLFLEKI